jgi:hypothetical protein
MSSSPKSSPSNKSVEETMAGREIGLGCSEAHSAKVIANVEVRERNNGIRVKDYHCSVKRALNDTVR